jgi:hypothetical protein
MRLTSYLYTVLLFEPPKFPLHPLKIQNILSRSGFVCEFGGKEKRELWREKNREKIRKIFYIF